MPNSMMLFSFCFWVGMPFLGKFGPKNRNCHFMLKFDTYTNSRMQNSIVIFILSVFDWKYPFWANLVENFKIGSWRQNLLPRLIRICRIQWWCSRFWFSSENSLLGKICFEKQNYQLKLKFSAWTNSNVLNSIVMFTFFLFKWKYLFSRNLAQKIKLSL